MRRVEIEPYDVFLFRDARPFGAADAAGMSLGLFPPPPSAVFGALRTAAFRSFGVPLRRSGPPEAGELSATWGDAHRLGSVVCRGPVVSLRGGPLWPAPATLLSEKDPRKGTPRLCLSKPSGELPLRASSLPAGLLPPWLSDPGVFKSAGGFVTTTALTKTLAGRAPDDGYVDESQVVKREDREGIALDPSRRTVRTGALFTMAFRRLVDGASFTVWLEGEASKSLPDSGLLRLGQDGKLGRFGVHPASAQDWPPKPAKSDNRFLIYLATPARFAQGWLPSWVDPATLRVRGRDFAARLVSVALERPQMLGGWDLARGRPRALHRLVRAGSVYFFETSTPEEARKAIETLHGSCISEGALEAGEAGEETSVPQAAAPMGFGFCFTGVW